jgi:exopolyphosphatase/guanosine-5'-triphosphate,3'-diphosphate pyrophosphatase
VLRRRSRQRSRQPGAGGPRARRRRGDREPALDRPDAARPIAAAVDLGSNSVHLLVAAIEGHRLEPLADESVFLRLGDVVHDGRPLGEAGRLELISALAGYAATARGLGASAVTFLGTEPIRRAPDASRIVDGVARATGVPLHVLSHEEEAYLTLIGVTEGEPVEHDTLVVDIGGGSSEFALVGPDRAAAAWGLQLGSARLTARRVEHDPPSSEEVAAMAEEARTVLVAAPHASPREIVGVGGTATNLVKLLPAGSGDRPLTRERLEEIQEILAGESADAAAQRHLINPVRARLLPAGGAIVGAILERYAVARMRVSDASLREGAILAVHHAGASWRDRLARLAHGWRT